MPIKAVLHPRTCSAYAYRSLYNHLNTLLIPSQIRLRHRHSCFIAAASCDLLCMLAWTANRRVGTEVSTRTRSVVPQSCSRVWCVVDVETLSSARLCKVNLISSATVERSSRQGPNVQTRFNIRLPAASQLVKPLQCAARGQCLTSVPNSRIRAGSRECEQLGPLFLLRRAPTCWAISPFDRAYQGVALASGLVLYPGVAFKP